MSKIICDVCGTAYPETNPKCPICGSANAGAEQTAAGESIPGAEETSYNYVKGGRFSKRNVRRRGKPVAKARDKEDQQDQTADTQDPAEKTNIALIAVVIVLLLAIIAVVVYIGLQFFGTSDGSSEDFASSGQISTTQPAETPDPSGQGSTTQPVEEVPCISLEVFPGELEFHEVHKVVELDVVATPVNTTDTVVYTSADEKVALVSQTGHVTAVGGGKTVITVTCGTVTKECTVDCKFEGYYPPVGDIPTEAPTEGETQLPTNPPQPVDPNFVFEFNTRYKDELTGYADTTISTAGGTWRAFKNNLSVQPVEITWTSDDPKIATVSNGIVTAIAPGKTLIHAQYGGQTYTCIVRCSWKATEGDNDDTAANTDGEVKISSDDVTIKIGESFWLKLTDADGKAVEVQWTTTEPAYVSIDGNKITGLKAKLAGVKVSCQYEGKTYTCIVRINGEG